MCIRDSFRSVRASYGFGLQRPYSGNLSASYGSFYDGTRTSVGFQRGRIELTPQLSLEPSLAFNWVDLPWGDFTQHVASTRVSYSFSPRLYLSGLLQYSTANEALRRIRVEYEVLPAILEPEEALEREDVPIHEPRKEGRNGNVTKHVHLEFGDVDDEMAGADVTMLCSALLARGTAHLRAVQDGLVRIMDAHGYASIDEMRGVMSQKSCPEPSAYERANYIKSLTTYGLTATFE